MTDIAAVIAAHRKVADLLEAHPHLAVPVILDDGHISWWLWPFECPDGVPAMVAAIRRAVGGKWDKSESSFFSDDGMRFTRDGYSILVKREEVCVRRVVGTETVTIPAVEAKPEQTVEREVVEWDCEPVLERAEEVSA